MRAVVFGVDAGQNRNAGGILPFVGGVEHLRDADGLREFMDYVFGVSGDAGSGGIAELSRGGENMRRVVDMVLTAAFHDVGENDIEDTENKTGYINGDKK